MKKILVCFLTCIVTGIGISDSFAGTYISGNLGLVIVNDSDTDDGFDTGEFTFDTGAGIVWALGSSFQNGGRVEAEWGYRSNSFDEFKVDGGGKVGLYGDISSHSLMGNAYYDISTEGSFSPFIGAGLGFAYLEADFDYFDRDDDEDDTVFAYQLILGGSFASSEQLSVDLQYRYFATDDPEFGGLDAEYSTHNVMIGFRRSF
jgi:opacity protein-like surface antigen